MISELCIRRPVMTILLMVSFLAAGMFGYRQLPVAAIPRVDFPTIQVTAQLPGASPETMASSWRWCSRSSSRPLPASPR